MGQKRKKNMFCLSKTSSFFFFFFLSILSPEGKKKIVQKMGKNGCPIKKKLANFFSLQSKACPFSARQEREKGKRISNKARM
jgi:hypothetical protein